MCFKLDFLKICHLFFLNTSQRTSLSLTRSLMVIIKKLRILLLIIKESLKLTKNICVYNSHAVDSSDELTT